jgi:hypothetical protein
MAQGTRRKAPAVVLKNVTKAGRARIKIRSFPYKNPKSEIPNPGPVARIPNRIIINKFFN